MKTGNTIAAHKGRFFVAAGHRNRQEARTGTEAAETVSADPPGRGGGSMLEDEGHQAKDAPADHGHGQQLPRILQHGSQSSPTACKGSKSID